MPQPEINDRVGSAATNHSSPPSQEANGWYGAIAQPSNEFACQALPIIAGQIPTGLRGSFYRNGPGRIGRGGIPVGHWFDGDGAILAVHFDRGGAQGTYRYVQTEGYLAEQQVGKLLFANYGMVAPIPWWQRFLNTDLKNCANTSVLALPDRLLALWEGGSPYALDLKTLATIGADDLDATLPNIPYSAHPKQDPVTGEIFNFGITYRGTTALNIFKSDRHGKIIQRKAIPLRGICPVHDFVLAGKYLLFCIPPVRLDVLPVLLKTKSYSESLRWQPQQGTQILVVDRNNLEIVSRSQVDAWYQWHFGNGYTDRDGNIMFDLVRYDDLATNQYLQEVITGNPQTKAVGELWQGRLQPETGKMLTMQRVSDRICEFPRINPHQVGQPHRHVYLAIHRRGVNTVKETFGAIGSFDYASATMHEADFGAGKYVSEPVYAPDVHNPEQGWLLITVYDATAHQSEVWVMDAQHLDNAEPVCRLALPEVVPLAFHSTWKPEQPEQ
ncbi:Carotenoid oxygenase [Thalassoporum mexicanum PCC 7367]|uniref:carotenoid oxygenase family protein n=1 Tax=Thalassoporum mexicanum TaxID=3457544 RepID=UPI00029F9204|nr:carotenoid oxygenase family protein [Pseudanabaena sp. PCC 7367]AFY70034.1 Carotenoid oxygenase [Pseudanabaena sp. PCC 7367]